MCVCVCRGYRADGRYWCARLIISAFSILCLSPSGALLRRVEEKQFRSIKTAVCLLMS